MRPLGSKQRSGPWVHENAHGREKHKRSERAEIADQLASALHPAEIRLIECDAGLPCPLCETGTDPQPES
jgi:hypothetical protein